MKALHILKAGSKLPSLANTPGDFDDWILNGMQPGAYPVNIVDGLNSDSLPPIHDVAGIVVTGSAAMVTDHEPWSERVAHWLREAASCNIPILGICYGHQLLAYALGGTVSDNPAGVEVGTITTTLSADARDDALFKSLSGPLKVQASHQQSVRQLPAHAIRLASSVMDVNHAFRIGQTVWGVQFHPEFDAQITQHYVNHYRPALQAQGADADQLLRQCENNGVGSLILQRFFKIATDSDS
jgi:GMP synthase (glutamine-hydrolysing)